MKTFRPSIHQSRADRVACVKSLPAACLGLVLATGSALAAPPGSIPFGVYDPEGAFSGDPVVSIEHLFLPWEGVDLDTLNIADAYARDRGRTLLVTIEPWIWGAPPRPDDLRNDVLSGRHDATMRAVCSVLETLQGPVTVRWGQEMDNPNGHFPWSMWQPADHIEAYRRMVEVCRSVAPGLQYMWSPAGEEGMEAFYPGDDVVDSIGLSVFGLQEYELAQFGVAQGYSDMLGPRYDRAVTFGKPIIVAELGYLGDADYIADWNDSVRRPDDRFSELVAVVYYNRKEVYPWPDGFGLPDWRNNGLPEN